MTDCFMGDDAYHNGAFMLAANFGFYCLFRAAGRSAPPARGRRRFDWGTTDGYEFYLNRAARELQDNILQPEARYWDEQVDHVNYDDYWKARDISRCI